MTPAGKIKCVELHMEAGIITGMCGDGGNDCGALRIAHVGVALSDADASVVSPFTSKTKTVRSVVDLCREGRCSLATSFASVKMLIMYGFVGSSFRVVQYFHGTILAEWCLIYMDGLVLVGLSYFLTLSKPLAYLGKQRPTSSLIGPTCLFSLFGQELINIIFLYQAIKFLKRQSWYCPFVPDNVDLSKWWLLSDTTIATCLFLVTCLQQQIAAWTFSFGSKFRQRFYRNYLLFAFLLLLLSFHFYLLLGGPNQVTDLFRIASSTNVIGLPDIPLPFEFRVQLFWFLIGNFLTCLLYESFVVLGPIRTYFREHFHTDLFQMRL